MASTKLRSQHHDLRGGAKREHRATSFADRRCRWWQVLMRTTLELPDPLFARLKARAVSERLNTQMPCVPTLDLRSR